MFHLLPSARVTGNPSTDCDAGLELCTEPHVLCAQLPRRQLTSDDGGAEYLVASSVFGEPWDFGSICHCFVWGWDVLSVMQLHPLPPIFTNSWIREPQRQPPKEIVFLDGLLNRLLDPRGPRNENA